MNKVLLCMELLRYLNKNQVINTATLADLLETNPRNIREYIKTLEECGYDIETIMGPNGGYRLKEECLLPSLRLTTSEIDVLKASNDYLSKRNDFFNYNDYFKAISKIISSDNNTNYEPLTIIDRYPLTMPRKELQFRYDVLNTAIKNQNKCRIVYLSSKNKENVHMIHPYKVFIYNDSWFVLCWNETVNEFGYFKINRILEIETQKEKYIPYKYYNESDFLDEFGMKQNGEYYNIKLELKDLYTVINERIYGKNQVITKIDDRTTILECNMQNKNMIKTFVLSFGAKARVIEPEWLKEAIKKEAEEIYNNNQE